MGGEAENNNSLATLSLGCVSSSSPLSATSSFLFRICWGVKTKKDWLRLLIVLGSVINGECWWVMEGLLMDTRPVLELGAVGLVVSKGTRVEVLVGSTIGSGSGTGGLILSLQGAHLCLLCLLSLGGGGLGMYSMDRPEFRFRMILIRSVGSD